MFKSTYFQLVELVIPASVTSNLQDTYFQQQPQLQSITGDKNIYIKAIEAYTAQDILSSPLTPGTTVASAADLANALITFREKGTDLKKQIPLVRLRNTFNGATPSNYHQWLFKDTYKIDWTQSRITTILTPGTGGTTAGPVSYLIGVHYSYDQDALDMKPVNLNVYTVKQ
jgi:hypothetical protein